MIKMNKDLSLVLAISFIAVAAGFLQFSREMKNALSFFLLYLL